MYTYYCCIPNIKTLLYCQCKSSLKYVNNEKYANVKSIDNIINKHYYNVFLSYKLFLILYRYLFDQYCKIQ